MTKLLVLLIVPVLFVLVGGFWFYRSFSRKTPYDFVEDFRRTFLIPHWRFTAHYNDGKLRRIVPLVMIIGGIGILVIGISRL